MQCGCACRYSPGGPGWDLFHCPYLSDTAMISTRSSSLGHEKHWNNVGEKCQMSAWQLQRMNVHKEIDRVMLAETAEKVHKAVAKDVGCLLFARMSGFTRVEET